MNDKLPCAESNHEYSIICDDGVDDLPNEAFVSDDDWSGDDSTPPSTPNNTVGTDTSAAAVVDSTVEWSHQRSKFSTSSTARKMRIGVYPTGTSLRRPDGNSNTTPIRTSLLIFGQWVRILLIDFPLTVLFALLVFVLAVHYISDNYFERQIELMDYLSSGERELADSTYYNRHCTVEDVSATSLEELELRTGRDTRHTAVEKMLTHGVVTFPERLVSKGTADALRNFIVTENAVHPHQWGLLEGANRHAWGLDMHMDPSIAQLWKELSSNRLFVESIEAIVGKDPAVVEFTAITAKYKAKSQKDHADVMSGASATQQARSFLTSYSLFIPLQDTTKDMGATSICPGTHLCNGGANKACFHGRRNIIMTGEKEFDDDDNPNNGNINNNNTITGTINKTTPVWAQGTGMLYNQQVTHKGRAHIDEGGLDRVVLILTFAPRPTTSRGGLETRIIPLRSAYQLLWRMYGHTFYDYANSEFRMTEPQKTLRALGLLKGNGINWITSVMSQLANEEHGGYDGEAYEKFMAEGDFFKYLPPFWQRNIISRFLNYVYPPDVDNWPPFIRGTLYNTETLLMQLNGLAIALYLSLALLIDVASMVVNKFRSNQRQESRWTFLKRTLFRLFVTHGLILLAGKYMVKHVDETNWAKAIKSGRAYRFPVYENVSTWLPSTLPNKSDIMMNKDYASDYYGSYARVLEYAHPGTAVWRRLKEPYGEGYTRLPNKELQHEFCTSLIDDIHTTRRFLKPDVQRQWARITDQTELLQLCHRELVMESAPLKDALLRQIDSLMTETRFGRFYWTAMQNEHIPSLLRSWDERIVGKDIVNPKQKKSSLRAKPAKGKARSKPFVRWSFLKPTSSMVPCIRQYSLPPKPEPKEPFNGAWWQENDIVEVMYGCKTNQWFQATITDADPTTMDFSVAYADGETASRVERHCIRSFYPYRLGDEVGLAPNRRGTITNIFDDGTFDIQLTNNDNGGSTVRASVGELYRSIPPPEVTMKVGMNVLVKKSNKKQFKPGVIMSVYDDGMYGVDSEEWGEVKVAATNILCPECL